MRPNFWLFFAVVMFVGTMILLANGDRLATAGAFFWSIYVLTRFAGGIPPGTR